MATDRRKLIEAHYQNVSTGNVDGEDEVFAANVVTLDPSVGRLEGLAAFKTYVTGFRTAFPDAQFVVDSWIESDTALAAEGRFTGTNTGPLVGPKGEAPPTGKRMELPYVDVFQFESDRVVRHAIYYDQMAFLGQLGLLGAAGALGG